MRSYTQLTETQRYQIEALRDLDMSQAEVARRVGVDRGTACRELKRNADGRSGRYRAELACRKAKERRQKRARADFRGTTRIPPDTQELGYAGRVFRTACLFPESTRFGPSGRVLGRKTGYSARRSPDVRRVIRPEVHPQPPGAPDQFRAEAATRNRSEANFQQDARAVIVIVAIRHRVASLPR